MLTRSLVLDAFLHAWPWVVVPAIVVLRARRSASLDDVTGAPPDDAPLVSIVIPARDERRNIERCVRAVLASDWPRLDVIVVDDHSTDGTAALAESVAQRDDRLRVLRNPDLPKGWFGKQWACTNGAASARGTIIGFLDADTAIAPDLVTRTVNALRARGADLLSVAGRQELGSFWERIVQPHVFAVLLARFGGTETVSRAKRPVDKIANGQCLFVRRDAYDAVGGHATVRHTVAEDLRLAQHFCAEGKRVHLVLGVDQLSTRMYTSLRELVRGWRKNVFAGGRDSVPGGALGRLLFPVLLVVPPLYWLLPPLFLALAWLGVGSPIVRDIGVVGTGASLVFWLATYLALGLSPLYALLYPLGALVMLGICLQAIARGSSVSWKGRAYVSR